MSINRKPLPKITRRRCEIANGMCGNMACSLVIWTWKTTGIVGEVRHVCSDPVCLMIGRINPKPSDLSRTEAPLG